MLASTFTEPALVVLVLVPGALLGRWAAKALGQPAVVGEIAACLALGALLSSRVHWGAQSPGWDLFKELGHLGLSLFLVGAAHEIRGGGHRLPRRALAWLSAGSILLPMGAGALLAAWIIAGGGGPHLRGDSGTPAFVLMLAIALAVTAVPVLAGILRDRDMEYTDEGRLSMASAVLIDALTWVLLTLAIGLHKGGDGPLRAVLVVLGGAMAALALRRLAGTPAVDRAACGYPRAAVLAVGLLALGAARLTQDMGLSDVFGAVMVGLALPSDGGLGPWTRSADLLGKLGRGLLPVLFLTAGTTLAAAPGGAFSWSATIVATALALAGKLVGGYLGARAGDQPPVSSFKLAVLMNTRGLTEIVILQIGYSAGLLAPTLYVALVIMALITTGLSGPLLWLADRIGTRAPVAVEPILQQVER
ncbi:cation:proton antiporter [Kitasatospora sp. NPDC096077]|uniref:cation:proton antiporter n=1 Tax=Kitasatospora sp. NPDC096077 TaxID=3155544 RepID=UPI003322967F